MASNATKLGGGNASGMFYYAPENTALPSYPGASLDGWTEVGDISEDGISWSTARDYDTLKNWALAIKRLIPGTDPQKVSAPIMDTTKEVFKVLFGKDNVTEIPATADHGVILTVDTSALNTPTAHAFLFVMKDGDDMIMLGTKSGFISSLGDVAFKATEGITWDAEISASDWTLVTDDGQSTES